MHEGGLRVPGIIERPARIRQPAVSEVPICTSDILPTIVELLGLEYPDGRPLDGVSLVGLLDGQMDARPRPIGFWHFAGPNADFRESAGTAAWTDHRFKLVRSGVAAFELYDLLADPGETTNAAAQHPEDVARMRQELQAWQRSVLASYANKDYAESDEEK